MRTIGVLSDCRVPTQRTGGHGLGRVVWDIADALNLHGYDVTLWAGPDSESPNGVNLITDADETERAQALNIDSCQIWIDCSHQHDLSREHPDAPIVNYILDTECDYLPPNGAVCNAWQRRHFRRAKIVPLGIDVEAIPFVADPQVETLVYAGKIHPLKGFDLALQVKQKSNRTVLFAGQLFGEMRPPNWRDEYTDPAKFYAFLGNAAAHLAPSRVDAGGRGILEAAACGTPTITLDWTGTREHVAHGVSGWVCQDVDEMVEALEDLPLIDRAGVRKWVQTTHGIEVMIDALIQLCEDVDAGKSW